MSNREHDNTEHPIWEGAIVGFLAAVEQGWIERQDVIMTAGSMIRELVAYGMLADYGELQKYLRQREALVRLVAKPVQSYDIPGPGVECRDVITGEQRGHWLMISFGYNGDEHEADMQLRALGMSHEVNETALKYDTGMWVLGFPGGPASN